VSGDVGIVVIRLTGELDLARRDEIRAALVVGGQEQGILVDLSSVTYADSTVLAELLRFQQDAGAARIPVALIVATPQFARIVNYAGLPDAFAIFADRGAALTYLGQQRS
jgi:anti-anti-sigma factor